MPTESPEVANNRRERMFELEKNGMTRSKIGKVYGISRQRVAQIMGPIEFRGHRKEIHVYAVPELFQKVVDIADHFGLHHKAGATAGQGSVGLLIEQIALGQLSVVRPEQVCDDSTGDVQEDRGEGADVYEAPAALARGLTYA